MSDETTQAIMGDAIAASLDESRPRRRQFFGWGKRGKKEPPPLTHCENCGTELRGYYCASCGQHAIDYRRSFGRVFLDVLDSFLNWDSKFFATIGLLLTRPWRLTNDFLAGKRVRYVHPLRLYLLVSIAFFFGVHQLTKQAKFQTTIPKSLTAEDRAEMKKAMNELPPEAQAKAEQAVGVLDGASERPLLQFSTTPSESDSPFEKWINARVKEKIGENGINAKVFFLTLVSNLPGMMLCCIPLFAFVLKILYLFRRVFYIDHLIYALHIHAFAYLATIVITLTGMGLNRVAPGAFPFIAFLIVTAVVQLFISIRRVYRQNWFVTIFKFFAGGFIYLFVLSVALGATFFVTLAL